MGRSSKRHRRSRLRRVGNDRVGLTDSTTEEDSPLHMVQTRSIQADVHVDVEGAGPSSAPADPSLAPAGPSSAPDGPSTEELPILETLRIDSEESSEVIVVPPQRVQPPARLVREDLERIDVVPEEEVPSTSAAARNQAYQETDLDDVCVPTPHFKTILETQPRCRQGFEDDYELENDKLEAQFRALAIVEKRPESVSNSRQNNSLPGIDSIIQ